MKVDRGEQTKSHWWLKLMECNPLMQHAKEQSWLNRCICREVDLAILFGRITFNQTAVRSLGWRNNLIDYRLLLFCLCSFLSLLLFPFLSSSSCLCLSVTPVSCSFSPPSKTLSMFTWKWGKLQVFSSSLPETLLLLQSVSHLMRTVAECCPLSELRWRWFDGGGRAASCCGGPCSELATL